MSQRPLVGETSPWLGNVQRRHQKVRHMVANLHSAQHSLFRRANRGWAFNNFVLFDFHLPIMEKRGVGVEQDLLPPRDRLQLHTRIAADSAAFRAFGGTSGST